MTTKKGYSKLSLLFGFEHLIAPYLITFIYRVGIAVILIGGLLSCFNSGGSSGGIGRVSLALGGTLLLLLLWRVMSELWILAFNIYQRLGDIKDLLTVQNNASKSSSKE